jgi:hypothetical protein
MSRGTVVALVVVILVGGGIGLYFGAKENADGPTARQPHAALEQKVDAVGVEPPEVTAREGRSP